MVLFKIPVHQQLSLLPIAGVITPVEELGDRAAAAPGRAGQQCGAGIPLTVYPPAGRRYPAGHRWIRYDIAVGAGHRVRFFITTIYFMVQACAQS